MSFIDIHGHYAWNIDDGMPSYEDARKALELARENRISAIVATPHVTPGVHTKDDIHDFIQRIDDLRMLATEYNIDILDGCELFLNHDYQKALDQNLFIPIEPKRLLAELTAEPPASPVRSDRLAIEIARHQYTDEYVNLTKDFYLKM